MRVLAIDVGTGTQDMLLFDSDGPVENSVQLIMPSPTLRIAQQVRAATAAGQAVVLHGVLMGGGPCHWAINDHLQAGLPVYATSAAARTFDDDLEKVQASGITLIDDEARADYAQAATEIELRDLDLPAINAALHAFGVEPDWDVLAVAVFDHGHAPPDVSDRKFRFDYLAERLHNQGWLTDLAFTRSEIPAAMTRLQAVAASAPPNAALVVMDTAPAAVLGALDDPFVSQHEQVIIANIGNFHALAFHLGSGAQQSNGHHTIRGLFEHHTGELQPEQLLAFIERLSRGTLTNAEIFGSQGHGALILDPAAAKDALVATTGPRQAFLQHGLNGAPPYRAVPHGDMMLAGCYGLLRAVAAKLPEHRQAIQRSLGQ
ncbi:MAG: pyruvate formate lyase-activating protein [Chloroflexi bacterium]|nr:MAG: pyruvate formate lyase-activating protein [Chloroflexota bacterium]